MYEVQKEPTMKNTRPAPPHVAACLAQIAKAHLGIKTLEKQRSDSLDFHEVGVWSVASALLAAFEAGRASR